MARNITATGAFAGFISYCRGKILELVAGAP
jgi:hypothetical protein